MPPVKRFFVISYNLIINCIWRKIIPKGINDFRKHIDMRISFDISILNNIRRPGGRRMR